MKCIELTKGHVAIVDDEDFERLAQWRWFCNTGGYATRTAPRSYPPGEKSVRKRVLMHREIITIPEGFEADHINGNRLDNRKCNLRQATRTQNSWNKGLRLDNATGFKGVHWNKQWRKFVAGIKCDKRRVFLGYFNTPEDAALAYNAAAVRLHGEFARLN